VNVSGQLIYPEARAALAAAARATPHRPLDARLRGRHPSKELYGQLRIVAIDEPLARYAGDLAAEYALRGYDAVHHACALHVQGDDILLATWDTGLSAAAHATGRLTVNDARSPTGSATAAAVARKSIRRVPPHESAVRSP